jgi:hypothetical protein
MLKESEKKTLFFHSFFFVVVISAFLTRNDFVGCEPIGMNDSIKEMLLFFLFFAIALFDV